MMGAGRWVLGVGIHNRIANTYHLAPNTQHPSVSSPQKGVYNPKAFLLHAASLRQAFAHCGIFPTAASRRSLGRVSVPVWLIILSDQLTIVGLVSLYLTNYLIVRRPLPKRRSFGPKAICGIR